MFFIFNVSLFSHATFALVVRCGVFRLLKTDCANMHMHHVLGINVASRYSLSVKSLSLFFYVWKNVSLCTRIIARELLKSSRYFISRKISKFHFSNIFQKLKDNFQISTPSCFHFHRISTVNIFYYRNIYS